MITPNQIKEKQLSTSTHGYDIDETNAFLNEIADSYSAIYAENKELCRKMEILANKIVEYREEEDSIKEAILAAQKTASEITKTAKANADKLKSETEETSKTTVAKAKSEAEKLISEARDYVANLTKEKTAAANEIAAEAEKKASGILSNAKNAVQDMFKQTKNISDELVVKAKEEKEYHEHLVSKLKEESDSFKANLISIYEAQLEKIKNMADPAVEAAKLLALEKLEEIESKYGNVDELIKKTAGVVDEKPAEEKKNEVAAPVEKPAAEAVKPAAPAEKPVAEAVKPAAPVEKPAAEAVKPAAPAEKSVAEAVKPAAPAEKPVAETAEKTAPAPVKEKPLEATQRVPVIAVKDAEIEDISEVNSENEPSMIDVNLDNAIDAFSKDEITPNEGPAVTEITEEPEMEPAKEAENNEGLPFETFFNVKAEGRTTEKISLIPPDDFEDDDDELKFRGFFKKKNKK